jgi:hypothetical protein
MADLEGLIYRNNISISTQQTIFQLIAASDHRVKILEVGVSFAGTSSSAEPADIVLQRQSSAGSGSSAATVTKLDDSLAETLQTTGIQGFSSEPTSGDIVGSWHTHTQGGLIWRPPGKLIVGGGDRLGLRITIASATATNAYILFEE